MSESRMTVRQEGGSLSVQISLTARDQERMSAAKLEEFSRGLSLIASSFHGDEGRDL